MEQTRTRTRRTLADIVRETGTKEDTATRSLRRWRDKGADVPGLSPELSVSMSAELSDDLADYLLEKWGKGGQEDTADTVREAKPAAAPKQQPAPRPKPVQAAGPRGILQENPATAAALGMLILADGVSAAYVAWHGYNDQYATLAAPFFFFVGIAVGYAAIKNALDYKGYNADNWLIALALYQFLLHGASLGLFEFIAPGTSIEIGKWALASSVPAGGFGAVLALRSQRDKK